MSEDREPFNQTQGIDREDPSGWEGGLAPAPIILKSLFILQSLLAHLRRQKHSGGRGRVGGACAAATGGAFPKSQQPWLHCPGCVRDNG